MEGRDTNTAEPRFAYDADDTQQRQVNADERQYAVAWHAVAQALPTVPEKARGGVARALLADAPTFTIDIDGQVVELDLAPVRAKFAELITQVVTEEIVDKSKVDAMVASKEASGLALRKSKLDEELGELGLTDLKKTPSLWPRVMTVTNTLLEVALAQEMMRVAGVLRVEVPWLTGLPTTLARAHAAAAAPALSAAEDKPFDVGEVVTLKSGGPKMTVVSRDGDERDPDPQFTCLWFPDQSSPQRFQFKRSLLRRA